MNRVMEESGETLICALLFKLILFGGETRIIRQVFLFQKQFLKDLGLFSLKVFTLMRALKLR